MTLISSFLLLAETYCRAAGIAEATLSSRMFRDGKRIGQIREGSDIGVRRLDVAVQWLSDNWPEGFDWPAGVVRPASSTKIAEAAE
ncbi:hypothetical protein [Neorhizobium petrolearium]|uniref:Uncharacterized protein n=1 Tax=Neorhizobium petrolearium TaxID=515361 RepID=A0ABY8M4S6_9HYPH|nr:hypothetical protein [Neorhizobium petrolearium]MCC2608365.1 hypothetical protein [Neorhizobium petrolearium]WGI68644.1 hypothetical protein QEO92_00655 [Neorhizobium petrolearium]